MKEIIWFGDLTETHILCPNYIATYVGADITVLEVEDAVFDYLTSLGRRNPKYALPIDTKTIAPRCTVSIRGYEFEGWDFYTLEEFTPNTPIFSPFDEPEYTGHWYADNLDEYLEEGLCCDPFDKHDKAEMVFALAKYNNLSVANFLWNIERSKYNESLVENKNHNR